MKSIEQSVQPDSAMSRLLHTQNSRHVSLTG